MKTIGHVNSSYWDWFENESYFQSRLSDVFFIGFQENLSVDFEKLKLKLGLPQNVVLPLDDLRAHRNPLGSNVGLEREAIENLRKWYARDYDFLEICRKMAEVVNAP